MGSKENFALVEELAEVMGGVVGDHQTCNRGKAGYPEPTRSGSPARSSLRSSTSHMESPAHQHVSGMIGSGYIVAINKDEDASIFDVADAGIVGDVTKILPVMIEEMKKRKAE